MKNWGALKVYCNEFIIWPPKLLTRHKMKTKMSFTEEMEFFFRGYSENERQKIESSPFYQGAAKKSEINTSQEIALEILEGDAKTKKEWRCFRKIKEFK
jgi:hypothetical protein